MTPSKNCKLCGNVYYKKVNCSKKNWLLSNYCSRECSIKNWNSVGREAFSKKVFTEEEKNNLPYLFKKGHKTSDPIYLQEWRDNGGVVRNKGKYGYRLKNTTRKGETGKNIRDSVKYRKRRQSIYIRDNFTCVICKTSSHEKAVLNADHIIPFSTLLAKYEIATIREAYKCLPLWEMSNGRTLCSKCHKQTDTYGHKATKMLNSK